MAWLYMAIYDSDDNEYSDESDIINEYSIYDFLYNLLAGLIA